jgi:hypothetical protein
MQPRKNNNNKYSNNFSSSNTHSNSGLYNKNTNNHLKDNRPIKPSKNGKYNLNFIDWNNEWERVSEIEVKIENGEEIEDKEEEERVRNYMNQQMSKLGVSLNRFEIVKNPELYLKKECYICLKLFTKNKRIRILPCKHMFCEDCLRPWFKNNFTCPTCKCKLKNEDEEEYAGQDGNEY